MALDTIVSNPFVEIVAYTIISAVAGLILLMLVSFMIPKLVDRITPNIDDEKEMLRGNIAVGNYVGLVTSSVIIGISLILAAAIIAAVM